MAGSPVPIYFVINFGQRNLGSAKMRGADLARIVSPHLGDRFCARVVAMPGRKHPLLQRLWARTRPRGGIYFLTKTSCQIDPEAAFSLKQRSHGLCFDYVDHNMSLIAAELADVHVCSSYAQEGWIRSRQAAGEFADGPTAVILHNADAALYGLAQPVRDSYSAVYCGNRVNTHIPAALAREITVLDGSKPRRMRRTLDQLPGFALHYGLRGAGGDLPSVVKPFTKGATAAVCHANILTSRDVPDAERLLGADYPFLIDGAGDAEVIEAYRHARDAFGGPDWVRGLGAMASLRGQVSGPALAAGFRQMAALLGVS